MFAFVFNAVLISLSGVISPGPMTFAALDCGTRRPHAGVLLSAGHVLVEAPLVVVLIIGVAPWIDNIAVQGTIGAVGGCFLLWMAWGQWRSLSADAKADAPRSRLENPLLTGFLLSAANPLFVVWWAAVGLNLITEAWRDWGIVCLSLFLLLHWLCDLLWLEFLTISSSQGKRIYGAKWMKGVLVVCVLVLTYFGAAFLWDGARTLASAVRAPHASMEADDPPTELSR